MTRLKNDDVVIVSAARSPVGKFMGALKDWSATDLAGPVIRQLVKDFGFSVSEIRRLIVGNVYSAGLGQNPAKQAALQGGLTREVMAHGASRVCASSLQALWDAYHYVKCENELVIAAGMESMSQAPYLLARQEGLKPGTVSFNNMRRFLSQTSAAPNLLDWAPPSDLNFLDSMIYDGLEDAYSHKHMGEIASMLADEYPEILSREKQDLFAFRSHESARLAMTLMERHQNVLGIASGYPIKYDEGVREPDMEKLANLKPIFGNTITPGNASQLSDGAAALMVSSYREANKVLGLKPLARILAFGDSSGDPDYYTTAPVSASLHALWKAGIGIEEVDLIEINEAFAVVPLYFMHELGINPEKINVWGGAIAKGHPLGASGARIVTELAYALKFTKKRYGLAVACHGGGGAVAVIIENLQR